MSDEKKLKLVYSGELMLFVVVFVVLGTLLLTGVLSPADWKRYMFTYVTLIGGTWLIVDMIWTLASKKRRAKSCLMDKLMVLPVAPVLIPFAIYCIIHNCDESLPYRYFIGGNMIYLSIVFLFQSIYHYYKPTQQMLDIIKAATAEDEEEEKPSEEEEQKPAENEEKPSETGLNE